MSRGKARVLDVSFGREVVESNGVFIARRGRTPLYAAERAIRRAVAAKDVRALVIRAEDLELGWSKAESLHRAIAAFRATGRPSVAYLAGAGNAAYMMASACERVLLHPSSVLWLSSLSSESVFLRDLLGALGIEAELEAVGEYKSAGETFARREASGAHREQTRSILADLQEQFVERIASGRGISREEAADAVARGPFLAAEAEEAGLVDGAASDGDACETLLEETLGAKPSLISHRRYAASSWLRRAWRWRRPRIAVVHASGLLTRDEGRPPVGRRLSLSGAESLREQLEQLRSHPRVRGIVLRIDSPGGGAVASELVHRTVAKTAREKPVVVSMGDVAASGAYLIAAAASSVFAEGTSLTGSIGVVGGKIVVKRLLDRLGIHTETEAVGPNAGFASPLRSFSDAERAWYRKQLEHFYRKRFLPAVAEGRELSLPEVEAVGGGRVWTGRQGKKLGLVDALGGIEDAVERACDLCGLSRERVRVVVHAPRRRLRDLARAWLGGHGAAPDGPTAAATLSDCASVAEELAREELLLLMLGPWRIR